MNRIHFPAALVLFLAFMVPVDVYCYIDAGTGSFMLQMLIAGIVGSLFAIKIFFKRIVAGVRKLFGIKGPEQEEKGEGTEGAEK